MPEPDPNFVLDDGVFRSRVVTQPHEGITYRELTQTNEDAILEANQEKRKMEQRPMEWGRQVASIPAIVWDQWTKAHPDLTCNDKVARQRTIMRLLRENPQYTVVSKAQL